MVAKTPIGDITDFLNAVTAASDETKAKTQEYNATVEEQYGRVVKSTNDLYTRSQDALTKLNAIQDVGAKATGLANSDNFMDRIHLLGSQILDPRNYTSAGRSKQRAEIQTDLSMRENINSVVASDAAANIDLAKARLDGAASSEAMVTAGLRSRINATNLMQQQLQSDENLRIQSLIQFGNEDLTKALTQVDPKSGKISLGGFEYTPTEIRERKKSLDTREQLSLLAPDITNPELAAANIAHQRLMLQTMSTPEIGVIRANGGLAKDGTQYDPNLIDEMYNRSQQIDADSLAGKQAEFTANFFDDQYVASEGARLDSLKKTVPEDSPLRANLTKYGSQIAWANKALTEAKTPKEKALAIQQMLSAKDEFNQAAKAEATRLAGSDKEMADLLYAKLTTGSMPPELLREKVEQRLAAEKPVSRLVPDNLTPKLRGYYRDEYNKLKQDETLNFATQGLGAVKQSDKDLKAQAAAAAYDRFQNEVADTAMNNAMLEMPGISGHPFNGVIPTSEWNDILVSSAEDSWNDIAREYKLSAEDITNAKEHRPVEGHNLGDLYSARQVAMFNRIFMELESRKPGLGGAYTTWVADNADKLAENYLNQSPIDVQPFMASSLRDRAQEYTDATLAARNRMLMTGAQKVGEYITSKHDPYFMNALILQTDDSLDNAQRKAIMDKVIRPILKLAKDGNESPTATMQAVDLALGQFKSDDKTLTNAIKRHLSQRTTIQTNIDRWIQEFSLKHANVPSFPMNLLDVGLTRNPNDYAPDYSQSGLSKSTLGWAYGPETQQ